MYNPTANASHRVVGDGIWSSGSFSGVSPINACKHCNILEEEEEDETEDEGEDVLVASIPSSICSTSTAHSAATSLWWGWTPLLVVQLL